MYCKKCGFNNENGQQFCTNCGAPLGSRVQKKKSKLKYILIGAGSVIAVLIVVVIAFIFFVGGGAENVEKDQEKYNTLVQEAEDAVILNGDYETALNDLKDAIEIDDTKEEAYLDIIEICCDSEAYDEARNYLNQALESVGETDHLNQEAIKLDSIDAGLIKDSPVIYYDGHKYEVWAGFNTIEEANNFFESIGGHAATITSKEEDEALYELYQTSGRTSLYFGLVEGSVEGDFRWVTGEDLSYVNWADGEPNNGNGNEAVGSYYLKFDGQWNDSLPNMDSYIICEYDA